MAKKIIITLSILVFFSLGLFFIEINKEIDKCLQFDVVNENTTSLYQIYCTDFSNNHIMRRNSLISLDGNLYIKFGIDNYYSSTYEMNIQNEELYIIVEKDNNFDLINKFTKESVLDIETGFIPIPISGKDIYLYNIENEVLSKLVNLENHFTSNINFGVVIKDPYYDLFYGYKQNINEFTVYNTNFEVLLQISDIELSYLMGTYNLIEFQNVYFTDNFLILEKENENIVINKNNYDTKYFNDSIKFIDKTSELIFFESELYTEIYDLAENETIYFYDENATLIGNNLVFQDFSIVLVEGNPIRIDGEVIGTYEDNYLLIKENDNEYSFVNKTNLFNIIYTSTTEEVYLLYNDVLLIKDVTKSSIIDLKNLSHFDFDSVYLSNDVSEIYTNGIKIPLMLTPSASNNIELINQIKDIYKGTIVYSKWYILHENASDINQISFYTEDDIVIETSLLPDNILLPKNMLK